ncbi:MAG TPA: NADH-quinone oxidoreductase subunit J [Myxococcota bacterium]|nr:NADH-quinone oxidoreductase subunit J [Myxococcota bacterium]
MLTLTPFAIIFYVFATVAVVSAVFVVTARNPVRSVLSLVVTFFAMAGVWMLLQAEFLSLILLLVYVGAVMTLFLFVVMMLDVEQSGRRNHFVSYLPVALIVAFLIAALLIEAYYLNTTYPAAVTGLSSELSTNNLVALGELLYSDYIYPVEIAGVILLAAIIAAITLTHRGGALKRKTQAIQAQVDMTPREAVRLVKMPAEKPGSSFDQTPDKQGGPT